MRWLLAITIPLLLVGCRKSEIDFDDSVLATSDQVLADIYVANTFLIVDEASKVEYGIIPSATTGYLSCATVTSNLAGIPNNVTVDFGSGCSGPDGRTRKGILYVTISGGNYSDSGVVASIGFNSYWIDDIKITGDLVITDLDTNASGNEIIGYSYTDLQFEHQDPNWTATLSGSGTRELVSGAGNFDVSDDAYSITGSGSGTSRSGNTYTATITSALYYANSCAYITQGQMDVKPDNLTTRFVDYGSGACDTLVTLVINNTTYMVDQP